MCRLGAEIGAFNLRNVVCCVMASTLPRNVDAPLRRRFYAAPSPQQPSARSPVASSQVDHFFPPTAGKLKDEVMTIKPVQKQSSAGQRTRFKAYVAVGDFDGHIGLGKKCSSEVATAIRGALIMAKMHLVPIRRGYWGFATASERKLRRARRF